MSIIGSFLITLSILYLIISLILYKKSISKENEKNVIASYPEDFEKEIHTRY